LPTANRPVPARTRPVRRTTPSRTACRRVRERDTRKPPEESTGANGNLPVYFYAISFSRRARPASGAAQGLLHYTVNRGGGGARTRTPSLLPPETDQSRSALLPWAPSMIEYRRDKSTSNPIQ